MASREEKIASARKKLKKFRQRGGATGKHAQLNLSAPSGDQMSLQEGSYVDVLNSTAPVHSARTAETGHSQNGFPSPGDASLDQILPVQVNGGGSPARPLTPTHVASPDFAPPATSTPRHQDHLAARDLQQQRVAAASYGVSPTHFGFRTSAVPAAATAGQRSTVPVNGVLNSTIGQSSAAADTSAVAQQAGRQLVAHTPAIIAATSKPAGSPRQENVDLNGFQRQLKAHQQTIDLLVEEKNSLQATCNKYDSVIRERDASILNYSLQLKSAGEQSDRLRSVLAQRESALQSQASRRTDVEFASLEADLKHSREEANESKQLVAELSRKVQSHASDGVQLRQERDSLAEKLRTTTTLLQQMSSESSVEDLQQVNQAALAEKARLEHQLANVSNSLQRTVEERDLASAQCSQAIEQANNIKSHLDSERATFAEQHSQFRLHFEQQAAQVNELKHQLDLAKQSGESVSMDKLQGMQRSLQALALEKQALTESASQESARVQELQQLSGEQAERIRQLEGHVAQITESNSDRQQMLSSIQADKAAISQATLANRQLRQRLEEMEALQAKAAEERKGLEARLAGDRDETKLLEERLEQKTGLLRQVQTELATCKEEVASLHSENDDLSDQLAKHVQISNRRQHLEAQGQLSDALQQELTTAQEAMQRLQAEKNELHQTVLQQQALLSAARDKDSADGDSDGNGSHVPIDGSQQALYDEQITALTNQVQQLVEERSKLHGQLQQYSQRYQHDMAAMHEEVNRQKTLQVAQQDPVEMEILRQSGSDPSLATLDAVPRHVFENTQKTLEELQDRFLTIMTEKAELVQKIHSLEHTTGQLEGETNTIGEYIALYQLQRDTLRKRYEKKDGYIEQLVEEQAKTEAKVEELRGLVTDLVAERKNLTARLLQSQSGHFQSESHIAGNVTSLETSTEEFGTASRSSPPADLSGVSLDDSATSLPAIAAANDEHRTEKILALLHDLKPATGTATPPPLLHEEPAIHPPGTARIGVDVEFLPCSCCAGRLLRV